MWWWEYHLFMIFAVFNVWVAACRRYREYINYSFLHFIIIHRRVDYRSRWSGFATTTGLGMVCDNHTAYWRDIRTSLSLSLISRWCATRDDVIRRGGRTTITIMLTIFHRLRESGLWTGATTLLQSTSLIRIHSETLRRCWKARTGTLRWAEWFSKRRIWSSVFSRSILTLWVLDNTS